VITVKDVDKIKFDTDKDVTFYDDDSVGFFDAGYTVTGDSYVSLTRDQMAQVVAKWNEREAK
jgi:hypothetical protein